MQEAMRSRGQLPCSWKALLQAKFSSVKVFPSPASALSPAKWGAGALGALCEAAQACEEKNGHIFQWLITRIVFLFCFVPLKGINSPCGKLELHLEPHCCRPCHFPAPEVVIVTMMDPKIFSVCAVFFFALFTWLKYPSAIERFGWEHVSILHKTRMTLVYFTISFRDKIQFCAETQKAGSCIARIKLLRPCRLSYTPGASERHQLSSFSSSSFFCSFFCLSFGRRKLIL